MEKLVEEGVRERAKRIILDIWKNLEEYADPETFFTGENEAGEVVIRVKVNQGDWGKAEMIFYPQSFIEPAIRVAESELKRLASEPKSLEIARFYYSQHIHHIANVFIDNLRWEAEMFVLEQSARSVHSVCTGMKHIPSSESLHKSTMKVLEDSVKERKSRMAFYSKKVENNYTASPVLFCHIYEAEKKRWTEARSSYKRVETFKNPLKILKDEYPDLPEDLLDRFGDKDQYDKAPATLALLSTARIAHLPESISAIRALQDYLKASRDLQRTTSKEEVRKEMARFRKSEKYMRKIYERIHSEREDKPNFEIREQKLEIIQKDLLD